MGPSRSVLLPIEECGSLSGVTQYSGAYRCEVGSPEGFIRDTEFCWGIREKLRRRQTQNRWDVCVAYEEVKETCVSLTDSTMGLQTPPHYLSGIDHVTP